MADDVAAKDRTLLYWLPAHEDVAAAIGQFRKAPPDSPAERLAALRGLAGHRLDFLQTRRVERALDEVADTLPADAPRLRLALLGSVTLDHLVPAIRVGALRRGLLVDVTVAPFGQWRQQVLDPESALYAFAPDCILLSVDMESLLPELAPDTSATDAAAAVDEAVAGLTRLWSLARERTGAAIVQEVPWRDAPPLYGHYERQVPASPGALARRLDVALGDAAAAEGALLLDLGAAAQGLGTDRVSDPALWHHAKQAVSPTAAPWAGDQIARILAAVRGLSKKVLALDLDNTLWGGVIGEDGPEGIAIGQGSAAGEAHAAFQHFVKRLAARGVVLAVSSKNDDAIARAAFEQNPEMVLRLDDFAAFEADWNDKPAALRRIADALSLGIDSFVFVDDNPVERALMRRMLPEVAVPELPDGPEHYARCLADAGYFEAVSFTAEDTVRNAQYAANRARRTLESEAGDMESFLRDLDMTLDVFPFRPADLARITQLINKTNQFNLTTRRYTEAEVRELMEDPDVMTFAARLRDRFGDNGLTGVAICRPANDRESPTAVEIDSWLMSCRILGRRIEHAMLAVMAEKAAAAGADALLGRYRPTAKNGLVEDLYPALGFTLRDEDGESGESRWVLPLDAAAAAPDHLRINYE